MKRTSIEWCTHSANPIKFRRADDPTGQRGSLWACVKVSAGCQACYAETLSRRFHGRGAGFTATRMATLTPYVDDAELKAMLSSRRLPAGSKVFVEDMSDLFGEWVTDEMLDRVFAVFALRADVVFQVLTKRPERMREYVEGESEKAKGESRGHAVTYASWDFPRGIDVFGEGYGVPWPLPNVWLGVSAEDQEQADKRIPELLATPAAVRFVSAEPLLGPIDFGWDDWGYGERPDWVIVGGESGPRARPCDVAWIRSIVGQCRAAGVAVFVKQLGAKPHQVKHQLQMAGVGAPLGLIAATVPVDVPIQLKSRTGGGMAEWPEDLRVREMPG